MKALIYKEFKLSMHPICYIFIICFPLMVLIPNYPVAIGFIYMLATYPILFLGANKGQSTNDLLYSTLLPVRKKDIVLARLITVMLIQIVFTIITACLLPLANMISENILTQSIPGQPAPSVPGLPRSGFLSIVGIAFIGYALSDLIFFPIYYYKGKSIVLSTICTIIFFTLFICTFTIVIPYIQGFEGYKKFLCESGILPQLLVFGIAIVIYFVMHYFVYKLSSRNLERVDF